MVHNQPFRLNKEWVVSNNRHIFLIYLDQKICGYLKHQEDAERMIVSLGKNIEEELRKERGKSYKVYSEIVEDGGRPTKFVIYEQALGYLRNSRPVVKHTLTFTSSYKCYYLQAPVVEQEDEVECAGTEEVEVAEEVEEVAGEADEVEEVAGEAEEVAEKVEEVVGEAEEVEEEAEEAEDEDEKVEENTEYNTVKETMNGVDRIDEVETFEQKFERKALRFIEGFVNFFDEL